MKKFLVLLLVITIAIIPFGAATFADQNQPETIISESSEPELRVTQCPHCLVGSILCVDTDYGSWVRTGSQRYCTHGYPFGVDIEYKRAVTKTYQCSKCSYGYTRTTYQYKWECEGHY